MRKALVAAALGLALFASPASAECISDLFKAKNHLQHTHLDRSTQTRARTLIEQAEMEKMDGDFERCSHFTRLLLRLLDL